jgi:hypothetical protein
MAGEKNGKPNIAPLRLSTLATFRSWGNSTGAGRAGLPGAKIIEDIYDFRFWILVCGCQNPVTRIQNRLLTSKPSKVKVEFQRATYFKSIHF